MSFSLCNASLRPLVRCDLPLEPESHAGTLLRQTRTRLQRLLQAPAPVLTSFAPSAAPRAEADGACRFRCRMLLDRVLHRAVGSRVAPVRLSVDRAGGRVVRAFSQSQAPFVQNILRHKQTSAGVCEALSAHWIETHSRGACLWQELFCGDGHLQHQPDSLVSIRLLQSVGMKRDVDQDEATALWLALRGVVPRPVRQRRSHATVVYGICNQVEGVTGPTGTRELLDAMLERRGEAALYKKVQLTGRLCAHAIALRVDQGVSFFDPNFGEFRFDDHASFRSWFAGEFWPRSCYGLELGLGQSFTVHEFERRAQA
jgi:YopT peptidase